MANLANFTFGSTAVRSFIDNNQEAWFVAADVCSILGYKNPSKTVADHCKTGGVTNRYTILDSLGRQQPVVAINEPNLYRLIVKSRKPEAEKFEAWVMEEILPTIRKTGSYTLTITPAQQQQLKEAVNKRANVTQHTHQSIWREFYNAFKVPKYQDLPANQFVQALQFLEGYSKPLHETNRLSTKPLLIDYADAALNAHYINVLAQHFEVIYTVWKEQLESTLRKIESPIAVRLHDRFIDGNGVLFLLKRNLNEKLFSGETSRIGH